MNIAAHHHDKFSSVSKIAKGPLDSVPYDPILYGDFIADDLNQTKPNDDFVYTSNSDTNEKTVTSGSNGDFISVAKSIPLALLIETNVFGPAHERRLKKYNEMQFEFKEGAIEETAFVESGTGSRNKDELEFISALLDKPETCDSHGCDKNLGVKNKRLFTPRNISDSIPSIPLIENSVSHLSVREQLSGRLVVMENEAPKALFSTGTLVSTMDQPRQIDTALLSKQIQSALTTFEPYFLSYNSKPVKSGIFTRKFHQYAPNNKRMAQFKSITSDIRKGVQQLKAKVYSSSYDADRELELSGILFAAINACDIEMVRQALTQGANINYASSSSYGRDAFQIVILRLSRIDAGLELNVDTLKLEKILKALISRDYNVNKLEIHQKSNNGWGPIHYCVLYGKLSRLQLLIQYGADPDLRTKQHMTPLMMACEIGRFDVAYFLIQHNANFRSKDSRNNTILHYAAKSGSITLLTFLVACGSACDKMFKNIDGETPISICESVECSEYLQKVPSKRHTMSQYI
jgi:hypothetical protein